MRRFRLLIVLVAVLAGLASASAVFAQGFGVYRAGCLRHGAWRRQRRVSLP